MKELVKIEKQTIGKEEINAVDARELWKFLESKQEFANWIKNRVKKYGFVQGVDFIFFSNFVKAKTISEANKTTKEYIVSLDMAKELSMLERNLKGREARKYFIDHAKTQDNFIKEMMQAVNDIDLGDIPEDGYKRYVYVAKEEISGRIKIGISKDPEQRIKALNTGNPEELILVAQFEAKKKGYQSEKDVHSLLKEHKVRSEWFDKDTDYTLISKVA